MLKREIYPVVRHLRSGPAGGSRKVTAGLSLSPSALLEERGMYDFSGSTRECSYARDGAWEIL